MEELLAELDNGLHVVQADVHPVLVRVIVGTGTLVRRRYEFRTTAGARHDRGNGSPG
jgi:hypothetical protein